MKNLVFIFVLIFCLPIFLLAQIIPFGLDGIKVTDLKVCNNILYAATVDSGVFRRDLSGGGWESLGLKNKLITSIYPYPFDTGRYSISVSVDYYARPGDSTYIFSLSNSGWIPDDSGMTFDPSYSGILSIDGYTFIDGSHILFAVGDFHWYKRLGQIWNSYGGPANNRIVKISKINDIWIGGSGSFFQPYIAKSTDNGDTWMWGDYEWLGSGAVSSIAFHPKDSTIIYSNIYGTVMKTRNGGETWDTTGFHSHFYVASIASDPFFGNHLFAGGDPFQLYETTNAGDSWQLITAVDSGNHITDIEIPETDWLELYISTYKNGVYRLSLPNAGFRKTTEMKSGWNFISLPLKNRDSIRPAVLPSTTSPVFTYEGEYQMKDTLRTGVGYWVKYDTPKTEYFIGEENLSDTISIRAGWNMVGSLSYPIHVSSIQCEPIGMTVGGFYKYNGNYSLSDTLKPGEGYWVKANEAGVIILDKSFTYSQSRSIIIVPDSEEPPPAPGIYVVGKEIPKSFGLEQNYPNPFNPITKLSYVVSHSSHVSIKVYDLFGREVAMLVNETKQPGEYEIEWNPSTNSDRALSSGVYFIRMIAGEYIATIRAIMMK